MPDKFEYPKEGWSNGRMRKVGEQKEARIPITNRSGVSGNEVRELEGVRKQKTQHLSENAPQQMQQMSPEEFNKYWEGGWSVVGKPHTVDPSKTDPSGIIIENDHPQIKQLQDQGWEGLTIPDERWGKGHIFMRPKAAPVESQGPEVA